MHTTADTACSLICRRFSWSSWPSCFCELCGTVCKPCLVAFLELSSCLCVDESRPNLSLRAPDWCTKRLQPDSHVFNVAATRESSPSGCPNCREVCQATATSRASRSHALSLFWPRCRCSFRCRALPISSVNRRHHCMWTRVTCLRDAPGISFLDREAKSIAFLSHKHAVADRSMSPCYRT